MHLPLLSSCRGAWHLGTGGHSRRIDIGMKLSGLLLGVLKRGTLATHWTHIRLVPCRSLTGRLQGLVSLAAHSHKGVLDKRWLPEQGRDSH